MIKPNTLGIYQFIRNAKYYDYPFFESIMSALPIADEIVIAECYSDKDNTFEELEKLAEQYPKIRIVRHPWVDHFSNLCVPGNFAALHLQTEWTMQLQADEVLHEDCYDEFNKIKYNSVMDTTAYLVHYTHMLANYETEFDFCYKQLIRVGRKGTGWKLIGDACQLDGGDFKAIRDSKIHIFHYGKIHSGDIGFKKEIDFQNLYKDIGFPDPKMKIMQEKLGKDFCDYVFLFEQDIKDGKVRKFSGAHPLIMKNRIEKFKQEGYEQFVSAIKSDLSLRSI